MWILNKYGHAINTDMVARFLQDEDTVWAELAAVPATASMHLVGATTVAEIVRNMISGAKVMEVQ